MLFSNERTHNQERRASARRDSVNAIAGTPPENRGDCRQCAHKPGPVSVADTRGLTHYPGLGNNFMHTEVQSRYRTHGGLTPPALVLVCGRLPMKKRFLRCTNAYYQERRASARRGFGNRVCNGDRLSEGDCVSRA